MRFLPAKPKRNQLILELNAIELQKLHSLDINGQRFSATIWMEYLIRDGLLDSELKKEGVHFPIGPDGKPTFRPSCGWYMAQADFRNALSLRCVDSKVLTRGNDLVLVMRYDGVFTEVYELDDFPCDHQALTITFNINCRISGPLPVELVVGKDCTLSMECIDLCPPARQWHINRYINVLPHMIGTGFLATNLAPRPS